MLGHYSLQLDPTQSTVAQVRKVGPDTIWTTISQGAMEVSFIGSSQQLTYLIQDLSRQVNQVSQQQFWPQQQQPQQQQQFQPGYQQQQIPFSQQVPTPQQQQTYNQQQGQHEILTPR